jgi:hypothetical protein
MKLLIFALCLSSLSGCVYLNNKYTPEYILIDGVLTNVSKIEDADKAELERIGTKYQIESIIFFKYE